jgi:hypothetical protein
MKASRASLLAHFAGHALPTVITRELDLKPMGLSDPLIRAEIAAQCFEIAKAMIDYIADELPEDEIIEL